MRFSVPACAVAVVLAAQLSAFVATSAIAAGTPTPGIEATVQPTSVPSPTSTATPAPVATATSTPTVPVHVEAVATRGAHRTKRTTGRTHHQHATATPTLTTASEQVQRNPVAHRSHKKKHHLRKAARGKAHATPTAKPSATPLVSQSAEDSIKPVTCNGTGKPLASKPFLLSPFHGWNSIVSYFDHDSPNFLRDGQIILSTGLTVTLGSRGQAADFPAYWSDGVRQYIYYDGHNGYDYNLWYQPVFAAAAGKVIFAAYEYPQLPHSGYGQMVMIDHRNGYVTLYGHFSRLEVKTGERVHAGQEIGISGNTGHSSGPHLHFTVFHNCSPTDPYGWSGSAPDPLANYEGETSEYLWKLPPLVFNPLPDLSGSDSLPSSSIPRLLLIRLPATSAGAKHFTVALVDEERRVVKILAKRRVEARMDTLNGAVVVVGRVTVSALYSLPEVLSVASLDQAGDARRDVLLALSSAALSTPHRTWHIGPSRAWTGYLVEWQGQTLLVGEGPRARRVRFRLSKGSGGVWSQNIQTDATNGRYVVDLGHLSSGQRATVSSELAGTRRVSHSAIVQSPTPGSIKIRSRSSHVSLSWSWAALGILPILAVCWVGFRRYQRQHADG